MSGCCRKPSLEELLKAAGFESMPEDVDELGFGLVEFVSMVCGNATKAQEFFRRAVREFRETFNLFDSDGSGDVDVQEFIDTLKQFKTINFDAQAIERILRRHCGEESFSMIDFLQMLCSDDPEVARYIKAQLKGFREAFNLFDVNRNGSISAVRLTLRDCCCTTLHLLSCRVVLRCTC